MIDDRGHTSFTQVWLQLVQECPEQIADLGERLTVVAFGCSPQALPTVPYRIMALPRWEPALVQALLTLLGDGEPEGGDHRHA